MLDSAAVFDPPHRECAARYHAAFGLQLPQFVECSSLDVCIPCARVLFFLDPTHTAFAAADPTLALRSCGIRPSTRLAPYLRRGTACTPAILPRPPFPGSPPLLGPPPPPPSPPFSE
ncbi:hypothetical protein B0H19DRAFT_1275328 [Mycena capillaripes]|nr:hypothetical protein B0H19DRAFT_1275328 [Mycena capillaripes]